MLFNSPAFVFGFLPCTIVLFFLAARYLGRVAAIGVLITAGIVFYGQWEAWHLLVLVPSIAVNYLAASAIIGARAKSPRRARGLLIGALAANLLTLGAFKYYNFAAGVAGGLTQTALPELTLSLPLGISFFTFTQITYLVDAARGKAERVSPLRYVLFVTYFPHLIAGPILHHSEIIPQFERPEPYRFDRVALADGASLFLLGLAKKTMLADPLSVFADYGFAGAAAGDISLFAAWGAALSFTFQLYFDFSGYSDMALGIARMMRIDLPVNFRSPYKARSIAEFWRRWHITLSRFLRDYVYIPLGGSRGGEWRRHRNLVLTMVIGGVWHGAGWTFLAWGALHGLFLSINRAFDRLGGAPGRWFRGPAWLATFLCIVVGWVFFRADSMGAAVNMLEGMAGMSGAYLPAQFTQLSPTLTALFGDLGSVPWLADGTILGLISMSVFVGASLLICLAGRNLYEMALPRRLLLAGLAIPFLIQAVVFARAPSPFIYFQF